MSDLNFKSSQALLAAENEESFDKMNNNLDIEFEKIDEARMGEELSPGHPNSKHDKAKRLNNVNLRKQVKLLNHINSVDVSGASSGPHTTKHSAKSMFNGVEAKADSRTDREEERLIKGIPIRQFCDEVFK